MRLWKYLELCSCQLFLSSVCLCAPWNQRLFKWTRLKGPAHEAPPGTSSWDIQTLSNGTQRKMSQMYFLNSEQHTKCIGETFDDLPRERTCWLPSSMSSSLGSISLMAWAPWSTSEVFQHHWHTVVGLKKCIIYINTEKDMLQSPTVLRCGGVRFLLFLGIWKK